MPPQPIKAIHKQVQIIMSNEFSNQTNKNLDRIMNELGDKWERISKIYQDSITERLRSKLETIALTGNIIDFNLESLFELFNRSESFRNHLKSSIIDFDIDIDLDGFSNSNVKKENSLADKDMQNPFLFRGLLHQDPLLKNDLLLSNNQFISINREIDKDINNLISEYENEINMDQSPVIFYRTPLGMRICTECVPKTINPALLFTLIKDSNTQDQDWAEIKSKLLPLMKRFSKEFNDILSDIGGVILEQQGRLDRREGAYHVNKLLYEYGEDVFSDRD